jgi:hypothetical protein
MNLIFNTRIFWRRITIWFVNYILSRYEGIEAPEEAFRHIYLEFLDFTDTLRIIFGRESIAEYTEITNAYAFAWRDLLTARLEGDTEAVGQYVNRLYQLMDDGAAFWAAIDPFFDEAELRCLMETYLRYTIEVANSFMTGEFSIEVSDRLTGLTDKLGDIFAENLYEYITSGFQYVPRPEDRGLCITYEQVDQIYRIRMVWFELIVWARSYMLSRYLGIGNTDEILARFRQVPLEYVSNLEKIFGKRPGEEELLREMNEYINLISAMITAQKEGNQTEIDRLTRLLYQNANERAASVSSVNPYWDVAEWRARLYNHLRYTIDESSAILSGDHLKSLNTFSMLMDLAENASGYLTQGLVYYLFQSSDEKENIILSFLKER